MKQIKRKKKGKKKNVQKKERYIFSYTEKGRAHKAP